ncbi:MAG: DNA/RNA-binding domain of Phe-tRNA-synthetase-like protein [Saprospiraceae bacterium]|jgi:DNA/RNA-binding domain of Phe-tRNA-synthetase-like protein|tara:strand:+ start:1693 stop:2343 length:651 start_codon:yes stop_codon:yes gene_type:complete
MKITEAIKSKCPNFRLGIISCSVQISDNQADLWAEINTKIVELETMETAAISKIPTIAATRKGYKALGKDPARYRPSAEALLRRVVKGKGLYKINNVVDLLNLVSISTGFSIGGYDADKIEGDVELGVGEVNEPYEGIGRGILNIEGLATFRDKKGAFGTPTSDSVRTSVTDDTTRFLMVFLDYGGLDELEKAIELGVDFLKRFGNASGIEIEIIK